MRLRDHPKLRYHGKPAWPPQWGGAYRPGAKFPNGEVGTLKALQALQATCTLILVIEFEGATYRGTLHLDDSSLLGPLYERLTRCVGQSIREIGDLEIDL